MWIRKINIVSILIFVSISHANNLHEEIHYGPTGNNFADGDKPAAQYIYEDGNEKPNIEGNHESIASIPHENGQGNHESIASIPHENGQDVRRFLVLQLARDATSAGENMNGGLEFFGVPIGPQLSSHKETGKTASNLRRNSESVVKPIQYIPVETAMNTDGQDTNHQEEVIRVPVKQLKQHFVSTSLIHSNRRGLQTFPPDQGNPLNTGLKALDGLQLFEFPTEFMNQPAMNNNESNDHNGDKKPEEKESSFFSRIQQIAKKLISQLIMEQ